MIKAAACALFVGSMATILACSSSSPNTGGFGNESGSSSGSGSGSAGDDASMGGGEGGGGSGSSSGSSNSGSTTGDDGGGCDPANLPVSGACKTCIQDMCTTQLAACATCDINCALTCTSCAGPCLGGSDSGTKPSGDGGSAGACAKLTSCSGCSLIGAVMASVQAPCMMAVTSGDDSMCQPYLMTIQATVPLCN